VLFDANPSHRGSAIIVVFCRAIVERVTTSRVVDSATAAAFWLFLSLLPLAAVAAMVAANIAIADVSVLHSIFTVVPESSRELVGSELGKVAALRGGTTTPISFVVFVWLASSGVHGLLDAFDATTRCKRSWLHKRAVAIAMCVALSVGVGALAAFAGALRRVMPALASLHRPERVLLGFVFEAALISLLFMTGISRRARKTMPVIPGAIASAVLHTALASGYVVYISSLGTGSAYQAGLATIGVTMTVVYLFTLSLLVGVTINAVLDDERASRTRDVTSARQGGEG
jgi:membrane protein